LGDGLISLDQYDPLPSGKDQYSLEFMREWQAIKLLDSDNRVLIGAVDSRRAELLQRLERFHRKPIEVLPIASADLSAYLGREMAGPHKTEASPREEDERLTLDRLANDAPIVNLVNSLLIDAVRLGASDIHIEAFDRQLRVRYRQDGLLRIHAEFESSRFPAIASRIKIMANLNIMERRLPQDGRITVAVGGNHVDMRVSIVPIARGESIVLRVFGTNEGPRSFDELGIEPERVAAIRAFYRIPHGLILATGPTGSGKTTTLNAMLRELKSDELKIITIEDPVEYLVDGIAQIQTNEQIHLTFDTILRRVLRQDPNVIMVGEIRDSPTAELALRAALTGHLVLSTLHTNDSVSSITRLRNMGVEPYLIASTLRGVIAQRLVRRLCPDCKTTRMPTAAERTLFKRHGLVPTMIPEAVGCKKCGGSGYRGRIALIELLTMDEGLEELVLSGARAPEIRAFLSNRGVISLAADGLGKVIAGQSTLGEVEREVEL